ncbi:unnamed protein product [Caenorhabditis angaria]|uniref:Uncharacterized protein n=1 Tax=Caenorhabditis angaria TaxID=860376 RepID=A0A9P1N6S8_9PELO|nr:unnamed protein product [Caenorhabditis angaria]
MEEDSSQAIDAPTTTSNVSGQFSFIKLLTDSDSECVSKPVQDDHSLEASDRLELAAEKSVAVEKLENNASKAYFLGIYSTEVNARISTRTVKISFVPRLISIELMTSTETSRHCLRQHVRLLSIILPRTADSLEVGILEVTFYQSLFPRNFSLTRNEFEYKSFTMP